MSRYPNLAAPGDNLAFTGRSNGYRRRRMWLTAGSFSWTVPDDLPVGADGYGRIRACVIGGGGGPSGALSEGTERSGGGGGFSLKDGIRVRPGDTASITVGAAGLIANLNSNPSSTVHYAGSSSITIAGVTITGTGAQGRIGGSGSGGDINTSGGTPASGASGNGGGACSGSPFGNGQHINAAMLETANQVYAPFGSPWATPFGYLQPAYSLTAHEDVTEQILAIAAKRSEWWDIEDIVHNGPLVVFTPSAGAGSYATIRLRVDSGLGAGAGPGPAGNGGGGSAGDGSFADMINGAPGAAFIWY